jgi:hypothetical protein
MSIIEGVNKLALSTEPGLICDREWACKLEAMEAMSSLAAGRGREYLLGKGSVSCDII